MSHLCLSAAAGAIDRMVTAAGARSGPKDTDGPVLGVTAGEWRAFVRGVRVKEWPASQGQAG
jgi:Domain of unknown function (DUF397)